ncbi:serine hydrolase domain-containing protein [Streptomyces stelliscabiei]|uniref:CubicO group peptidase (Beta-lactamase class C family) n=1 Tax=Streptomyces stelliscabiei TaxID=146820 RepID=A0A8I0TSF0_9ACTN|nr:serine hydrolase domain-containing protein [Streptomyces stelliscabiei]KND44118.1 beta-lactamase [Streptomyces stelliscabiei]MBE1598522.1 CubicO group peptidase (beta-lactamase class C family) [Streptomyces stelliscabiei]MDX2518659.1 serine hydrolase [Streptomyces stelliscabiei]MDX2556274.1 serine hydrolase [Streptomyces stelliscabiei]MDX2614608.1 serine hydrolase [Streptomyces stelliscabiei]
MTTPQEELLPVTRRALLHRIAVAQAEGRTPSLVAALVRGGETVWNGARTSVQGHAPDENVQYRIGSITKTFTAVLVLRLRDEGALDLGDPLEKHLPGTGVGEATIAELLAHTGGLAAESPSPWWERTPGSLRPELADVLGEQPHRHPVGRRFHYSNPGFTLLGALVEKLRGAAWEDVLRREVLEPLGLRRTTWHPVAPHAGGWAVHPWADVMLPEKVEDLGRMGPAGQLWSTAADLARFAVFLARGDDRVLGAESVREMRTPAAPGEAADVSAGSAYGLGMQLQHRDGRFLVGHSGSVPGFLAQLTISVEDDVAAVVLTNCTSGPVVSEVAADLVRIVAEAEPRIPDPWRPLPEVDPSVLELAGPWYWGTHCFALRLAADGGLSLDPLSATLRGARFRDNDDGSWTGLNGYFAGEVLRAVRRPDGTVSHLDLGSFVFTRQPYEEGAPVPGGVDPEGWRGVS